MKTIEITESEEVYLRNMMEWNPNENAASIMRKLKESKKTVETNFITGSWNPTQYPSSYFSGIIKIR